MSVPASGSRLALDKFGCVLHVAPSVSPSATSESINKTGVGEAEGRPGFLEGEKREERWSIGRRPLRGDVEVFQLTRGFTSKGQKHDINKCSNTAPR